MERPSGIATTPRWEVLSVEGPKAADFLDRMLTNVVGDLDDNEARPALLLEATGRLVSGGIFLRAGDGFHALCAEGGWRDALRDGLARYRVADPVEFEPLDLTGHLWLQPPPERLPERLFGVIREDDAYGLRLPWTGLAETLWVGPEKGKAPEAPDEIVEAERIAAGTPAFGRELDDGRIPLETGHHEWFNFAKGCYVGQEVIERMYSRGRAARRLVGFALEDGSTPPPGDLPRRLSGEERVRAEMTSAARHPDLGWVGLGFVSGDFAAEMLLEGSDGDRWRLRPLPLVAGRMLPQIHGQPA